MCTFLNESRQDTDFHQFSCLVLQAVIHGGVVTTESHGPRLPDRESWTHHHTEDIVVNSSHLTQRNIACEPQIQFMTLTLKIIKFMHP